MHWPQYVMIGFVAFGIVVELARDGTPRTGKHSFESSLISAIIGQWLLWMGGFYG